MRNYIIIVFLTIMLLGAGNSFAYKKGHAVHQTTQATHHKSKSHATHQKGKAHHKSYATHHKSKSHATHHKSKATASHHKSKAHAKHKKTVVEEEVFNYPVVRQTPTPVATTTPMHSAATEEKVADKDEKDYKCYRAWKKEIKREKKEYKARIKDYEGSPWAAERKRRKAYKKAWKADMIEHEFETGYYYDDRPFWWY